MRRIGVRIISHALTPLLRRAAADLEGFAHSDAAEGQWRIGGAEFSLNACEVSILELRFAISITIIDSN